jgi:DNA-binding transcriptional MerR regulator
MAVKPTNEKLYYSIGEVARMTGLEAYVLRYWEKEFSFLRPRKNRRGLRQYTARDIDIVNQIKFLRTKEGLTIEGVRTRLSLKRGPENAGKTSLKKDARARTLIRQIRKDVEDLLKVFP